VRKPFKKRKLHHPELISRQLLKRGVDVLFAPGGIDVVVVIGSRIGNRQQIGIDKYMVAAATPHVDTSVLRDTKHPRCRRRFAAIELMGLAPDGFHHVLGYVGCGKWRQAEPKHLGVNPWPEMIEQHRESFAVALDTDCGEQIVELAGSALFAPL
jgi:hypothetical protein